MKLFVFEIANYLLRRDEESLMKETHRERRKQERNQILSAYAFSRITPIEAVQEMLNMDREPEYKFIIPVRYPDSEDPDLIDLVEFVLTISVFRGLQGLYEEIMQAYKERIACSDRMSAIEDAFHKVACKYSGTWRYIEQDQVCLEID